MVDERDAGAERARLRVGDTDRQAVADQLMRALNEGRLTLDEYDDRVRQAYAARTYADLDGLLDDLPGVRPAERSGLATTSGARVPAQAGAPEHAAAQGPARSYSGLAVAWRVWATVVSINVAIWVLACLASQELIYFWPMWVAGPWGAVLLARTIGARASGSGHDGSALTGPGVAHRVVSGPGDPDAQVARAYRTREERWERRAQRWERRARRHAERWRH